MRFLTLAEALTIAEAVTGIDALTLARASRPDLLDSALHAPQAGFGDIEFYPDITDKAAVQSLTMFCVLNGYSLDVAADEAVDLMFAIAAGRLNETEVGSWISDRLQPLDGPQ